MILDKLNNKLKAGLTYMIDDNEYTNNKIKITSSGTKDLPITIQAENVILSNTTTLRIIGSNIIFSGFTFQDININKMIKLEGSNIRFENNTIQTLKRDVEFILGIYGQYCRVSNNTFRNFDKMGVIVNILVNKDKPNFCLIDNNKFNQRKSMEGKNGAEMIRMGDSKTSLLDCKSILYANMFNLCNGEIEIVSVKSCKNIIYNNKFIDCEGGLCFRHGKDNLAIYNYFNGVIKKEASGIRITDSGHRIFFNTFENIANENPFRSALSMMNGEIDNKLNGYAPVKDIIAKYNDFIYCENCLSIGIFNKRKSNVIPENVDVSENRFIKCSNVFNTSKKVKGHKKSKVTDNKLLKHDQKLNIENTKELSNVNIEEFYNNTYNKTFSNKAVIDPIIKPEIIIEPVIEIEEKRLLDEIVKRRDVVIIDEDEEYEKITVEPLPPRNNGLLLRLSDLKIQFEMLYKSNEERNKIILDIIKTLN